MQILLVDPADEARRALHASLTADGDPRHSIVHLRPRTPQLALLEEARRCDLILFGRRTTERTVVRIASLLRRSGLCMPVFVVTPEFEMGVPTSFKKAGVDEMINLRELDTPLIAWTFESSVKQAEVRKKAIELDRLTPQLAELGNTLSSINHEINNPLSVVRLAVYHLQTYDVPRERREMLLKLITENLDKMQARLDELRTVRRRLGIGSAPSAVHETLLHSSAGH